MSVLLKNTTRSLLSKKPFGLLELGMKFATDAEKRKGENNILARGKATAAGDAFFAFDLGESDFLSLAFRLAEHDQKNSGIA